MKFPDDLKVAHTKAEETPTLFATFKQLAYDMQKHSGACRGQCYEAIAGMYGYATWGKLVALWGKPWPVHVPDSAYEKGRRAYAEDVNPYPAGTAAHHDWYDGLDDAANGNRAG